MFIFPHLFQADPFVTQFMHFDGERLSIVHYQDQHRLARIVQRPWLHQPDRDIVRAGLDAIGLDPRKITIRDWYPPEGHTIPEWSLHRSGENVDQDLILHAPRELHATERDPAFLCALDIDTHEVGLPLLDAPSMEASTFLDHWKQRAFDATTRLIHQIATTT
jgi:hypothetical protein